MLTKTIVDNLERNQDWKEVQAYIQAVQQSLLVITDIDFTNKESAVIEARGRQLAAAKLKEILEPFFIKEQEQTDKIAEMKKKTGLS